MSDELIAKSRLHAIVSGRVQGVGFRHFVMMEVERQCPKIVGKVRNTFDGNVEVIAEGLVEDLRTLIAILQAGPRWSQVENVTQLWDVAHDNLGNTFTVTFSQEDWST